MNFAKLHTLHVLTVLSLSFVILFLAACASQQPKPAEQLLPKSITLKNAEQAEFDKGIELLKRSELVKAKAIFEKLNKRHPDYLGPLSNLGIVSLKQGYTDQAKSYFQQILNINSANTNALNYLGVIARKEGRFEDAEAYYHQVLASDANNLMALRNLGVLLDLYRGRLKEALVLYEKYQSLRAKPDAKMKDWIFDIKSRIKSASN